MMYRLRTLGAFAIERDGATLHRVAAHRKAFALLAVLAAQGSTARERLAVLLWPESDAERAKGSLNQAIHLLRRQLDAPDLLLGNVELSLNPERIDSDVGLFQHALQAGDPAAAVAHYGGVFLDGVYLEGAGEFERWVETRRSELARRYVDALEQLARAAEERPDPAEAVGWWRQMQNADPLSGRAALGLMLALEACGDRPAALQHARVHEALLREELGIAPDPAIAALTARLRSPAEPPPPRREPVPESPPAPAEAAVHESPGGDPPAGSSAAPAIAARRPRRTALLALGLVLGLGGAVAALASARGWIGSGPAAAPAVGPAPGAAQVPVAGPGSIAVLPFLDLSPERDQQYFSDGIAEELITALSRVDGLRVVARTSAFQFRNSNLDVREVGTKLGVAHVIEGSVRKAGDRLRVSAQLVSTRDGLQLWSETYDRRLSDVFAVQSEISQAIAQALQAQLGAGRQAGLEAAPTRDIDAYEAYLKGLYFLNRLQVPQAIEYLNLATRRDAGFARAYAALAEAYAVPAGYDELPPEGLRTRGVAAARAALRLDPSLADAHAALGWLEMLAYRWDRAERSLRRAVELDPQSARARFYYAVFLHRQARLHDALVQLRVARGLDPLSLPINAMYGSFLGDLGRVEDAVAQLQATLQMDPSFPIAHAMLGHIYMGTGRTDEAVRRYERAAQIVPTSVYAGFLGHAYGRAGRTADARRILRDLHRRAGRNEYVSPGAVGWVHLGLGERDEGFRWLQRAAEERDAFFVIYAVLTNEYLSTPFRDDPRVQRLRRDVGLAQR